MSAKNTAPYDNIVCLRAALWKDDRNITISDPSLRHWGFQTSECVQTGRSTEAEGITIHSLMARFGIDYIDFLRIDIEGAEREVFESAPPWIDRVGAPPAIGMYLGGDPTGAISPSGAFGDNVRLDDVVVLNFATGVQLGNRTFSESFTNSRFESTLTAIYVPSGLALSGEKMIVSNCQFVNQYKGIDDELGMEWMIDKTTFANMLDVAITVAGTNPAGNHLNISHSHTSRQTPAFCRPEDSSQISPPARLERRRCLAASFRVIGNPVEGQPGRRPTGLILASAGSARLESGRGPSNS
jgi:hypothetical protein